MGDFYKVGSVKATQLLWARQKQSLVNKKLNNNEPGQYLEEWPFLFCFNGISTFLGYLMPNLSH